MSLGVYPVRDERTVFADAKKSGLFPDRTVSHIQQCVKDKAKAEEASQVNFVRNRRIQNQQRYNAELELERLRADRDTSRLPGLRGTAARIAQLEQLTRQVATL